MKLKQSEKFENVATKIFSRLLEAFPEPIVFYAMDIGIFDEPPEGSVETIGSIPVLLHRKSGPEQIFVSHCIEWLASEKYLTATHKEFDIFGKVVLTEKGLMILNAIPQCLNRNFNENS